MTVAALLGYAYPWDVAEDPAFPARFQRFGISDVAVAAAYHAVRAATPHHPLRRVVDAKHSALYRPVQRADWHGAAITARPAPWTRDPDAFATALDQLHREGMNGWAWLVVCHLDPAAAETNPFAVHNCLGELYDYALCPSHLEVVDYAARLATAALGAVRVDGVVVEAAGQPGLSHAGLHDKTGTAWPGAMERLLSVCCCVACRRNWRAAGADDTDIVARLRAAVLAPAHPPEVLPAEVPAEALPGGPAGSVVAHALGRDLAGLVLETRSGTGQRLRDAVLGAVRATAGQVPVVLHGDPNPWATGANAAIGMPPAGVCVAVNAWGATGIDTVSAARARYGPQARIAAYVTVLDTPSGTPRHAGQPAEHARALYAAGADTIHLYHLGLASARQADAIRAWATCTREHAHG